MIEIINIGGNYYQNTLDIVQELNQLFPKLYPVQSCFPSHCLSCSRVTNTTRLHCCKSYYIPYKIQHFFCLCSLQLCVLLCAKTYNIDCMNYLFIEQFLYYIIRIITRKNIRLFQNRQVARLKGVRHPFYLIHKLVFKKLMILTCTHIKSSYQNSLFLAINYEIKLGLDSQLHACHFTNDITVKFI